MTKWFALGIALAVAVSATSSSAATIEIVQYGLFTTEEVEPRTGDFETMKAAVVTNVCHVMTTSTVPASGGEFGFRYRVLGKPIGAPVDITHVLIYPDFRKPIDAPVAYVTNRERVRMITGEISYRSWANRRSRVGPWTFQIWERDRLLVEKVFTMVPKKDFKVWPDNDPACFQMSSLEGGTKWHWI